MVDTGAALILMPFPLKRTGRKRMGEGRERAGEEQKKREKRRSM